MTLHCSRPVPRHASGSARETGSNDIDISCYQVALVPDRWSGLAQVWIVAEDRCACDGHGSIDNPIVAGPHYTETAKLFELFVLLQHAEVDSSILDARGNNQWMLRVIAGF